MKTRTLCTVALAAIVSASLAGSATAFADEHSLKGKGIIEIIEDNGDNGDIDPEKPGTIIPENPDTVDNNPILGPITIDRVAVLNFGQQKVSTKSETYNAAEIPVTEVAPDGTQTAGKVRGPYVQWTDKRAGDDHTYSIKAEMTKQFTHTTKTTKTLDKATIAYTNGLLNSTQENVNYWPAGEPNSFTLGNGATNPGAGKQLVFDNTASTGAVGLGTYSAEFGQSADFDPSLMIRTGASDAGKGKSNSSVSLTVPAQTVELGTYEADITWSIEYTPAP